jgi:hypothetical protein
MKLIVRTLILFALVLWIGGVLFFPVVVSEVLRSGASPHITGTIIGRSLHDLHYEGIWTGIAFLVLLYAAYKFRALPRSVLPLTVVAIGLLGLTVFSQFWIVPRMEHSRMAAAGAISNVAPSDPNQVSFHKLHYASEVVEVALAVGGITLMALLAWNFPAEERCARYQDDAGKENGADISTVHCLQSTRERD